MMRRLVTATIAVSATLTLATGCGSDDSSDSSAPAPPVQSATATPSPSVPSQPSPSVTTSAPAPSTSVSPSQSPAAPKKLKSGAKGAQVVALQQRLTELGYWNGKADGKFGSTTQQAVYALQKTAGLGRDGVVGPKTQAALDDGVRPKVRSKAGSGRVVEIDLKKQLLLLVDDGKLTQIFNTSTGSNEYYEQKGQTYLADTPPGKFRVQRQIDGWRDAPLGLLWRPKYFNGGIAVHGAPSVPPYPASHGCARLSIAAMNWIWNNDQMPIKTRVWVYKA